MQSPIRHFRGVIAAAVAGLTLAVSAPAMAQDVDFSGKTVEFWIPFSEGGGSDVWARFLSPYLVRHLDGNPNVIVRNVPGGGSITGSNEFAARARPNGLQMLGTSGSTQFPYLLGDRRVRYDLAEFQPVVVSPTGGVVYIPSSFEVADASELGKIADRELVYASQGATSLDLVPMLAFEVMGLNVRHVFGMTGRGDGRLAFERGEATIDYQTTSAYLTNVVPLVQAGTAVPLFSYGVLDAEGNIQRDPTFPDIPHFAEAYEMMHGEPPSGVAFEAYKAFFVAGFAAQKNAVLPKDTPEPIVKAYRDAFAAAAADPELVAAAGEILGEYTQAVGDDAERLYRVATTIDPESREWVRNYLRERHNVTLD
ncbi:MAG: tripartite tricarboxylate transporter substrate-binding protein [Paracoccus sp. (in: a-proteobacteria)]|uniref:Bug family tripartite tricarboxylate transporter substrate binding protein n=1 Tax=Paracoccus sp. TaxID=267 RepID=UPI0026DF2FF9|nr:tripartite tricarboxylate transporter substrate-binding protein [Paracoccus sp. (in: a-proteobacteria)]MDO5614089.1 tripartite tricarboxylate transporter substrate-binding protein [Paracoccus sp. (in: a-proteobacteria)]